MLSLSELQRELSKINNTKQDNHSEIYTGKFQAQQQPYSHRSSSLPPPVPLLRPQLIQPKPRSSERVLETHIHTVRVPLKGCSKNTHTHTLSSGVPLPQSTHTFSSLSAHFLSTHLSLQPSPLLRILLNLPLSKSILCTPLLALLQSSQYFSVFQYFHPINSVNPVLFTNTRRANFLPTLSPFS